MPGNVQFGSPTTVLPLSLSLAFRETRAWELNINEYRNGESQRAALVDASRTGWRLQKKLNANDLQALADFWIARRGMVEAFWFYDPFNPGTGVAIGGNYDATGANVQGRHPVRFDNATLTLNFQRGRPTTEVSLIEVV